MPALCDCRKLVFEEKSLKNIQKKLTFVIFSKNTYLNV